MTAEQARRLTDDNLNIKETHTLDNINELIKEVCLDGKNILYFNGNITNQTYWNIENNGFVITSQNKPIKNNIHNVDYWIQW